jgi:hypothetical protein
MQRACVRASEAYWRRHNAKRFHSGEPRRHRQALPASRTCMTVQHRVSLSKSSIDVSAFILGRASATPARPCRATRGPRLPRHPLHRPAAARKPPRLCARSCVERRFRGAPPRPFFRRRCSWQTLPPPLLNHSSACRTCRTSRRRTCRREQQERAKKAPSPSSVWAGTGHC